MAQKISFGSMFVGKVPAEAPAAAEELAILPLHVLLLGNFSGNRDDSAPLARPRVVDRDNLDEVLAKLKPAVRLAGIHPDGTAVEIHFEQLDDFHPDRLYERLEVFEALRDTREQLGSQATYAAAAAEVRGWAEARVERQASRPETLPSASSFADDPTAPPQPISTEGLLDQVLDQSDLVEPVARAVRQSSVFQKLLEQVTGPYRIEADDPAKEELVGLVDELIADRMRAILHHPEFQALEAAWRGVEFLTRRVETDAKLKLCILDLSKEQLAGDLESAGQLRDSAFYRLVVELPAGSPPWGSIVGNYQFAATRPDVELLGRIAQIAARAAAPFLAAADPQVFGASSLADRPDPDDWEPLEPAAADMWQQLRQLPAATSLGLAAPRFLLRLPYGRDASPTERFDFEELPAPNHAAYLWGNGAIACACMLARGFSENGWDLSETLNPVIDDLPVHVYDDDGEHRIKPCAEALLSDRAIEQVLDAGLIPLQTYADRGAVRIARLQSLAEPPAALAGRWH